jgi:hypothetical protein
MYCCSEQKSKIFHSVTPTTGNTIFFLADVWLCRCLIATLLLFYLERYKEQNTHQVSPYLLHYAFKTCTEAAWRLVLSSRRCVDSVALEQRNIMGIGREFLCLDLLHSQYHMYCVCTVGCTNAGACRGMLYTGHVSLAWLHFSLCSLFHPNIVSYTATSIESSPFFDLYHEHIYMHV